MRKNAFSIVELMIVVFLLVGIASILVPMNLSNLKQAERVSLWKNTYEEIKYSIDVMKAKRPELSELIASGKAGDTIEAFDIVKPYLNIKDDDSYNDKLKNYHYKFLNGQKVKKKSDFYTDDFVILESGVIMGFKVNNDVVNSNNSHRAIMLFDVNGFDRPNRIGKDVFGLYLYSDRIEPFGEGYSDLALKTNCSPLGTGVLCSKYYLIGGAF